ncbi:DUF2264 C-terminal domain-containing protein [Enterobacter asburiae]|uniref:DUF2264 C-terminal domain-containing protein n=1 Tax=Enterobacter asburiae TaxID=61645 RepID=UPI0032D576F7
MKTLLVLALDEKSSFWRADCEPLPALESVRAIPEAGQFIIHDSNQKHAWMLMSGQFDRNDFVNFGPKYGKFAYSSHFGFTLERGSYGLHHVACDSMLMLSTGDGYFRGRRECRNVVMTDEWLRSEWLPWPDVEVITWLLPFPWGHIRIHRVSTPRRLTAAEGGFSVNQHNLSHSDNQAHSLSLHANGTSSYIGDLLHHRRSQTVVTPPNSNILFSPPALIPCLYRELYAGTHWLACVVSASPEEQITVPATIAFDYLHQLLTLSGKTISIT